jgi:hypothetical protein
VHVPNPITLLVPPDASGAATTRIAAPIWPGLCGVLVTGQYIEFATGSCPARISDAIAITIGN